MPDREYFDALAAVWDDIRQQDKQRLKYLVSLIGFKNEDIVLDVGCGTGVLFEFILPLIENGILYAVDYSSGMLNAAKEKYTAHSNILYFNTDIMDLSFNNKFDKIICLNFFPHIQDKFLFLTHVHNMLKPSAKLIIMHDISRTQVNSIHNKAGEAVKNDRLPPIDVLLQMMYDCGYKELNAFENNCCYFVSGQK